MIDAKELRIGNYIDAVHKGIDAVKSIKLHATKDGYFYLVDGILQEHFSPIKLTKEWLVKAGFEYLDKNAGLKGYWLNGICIEVICEVLIDRRNGITLKYVHQLQNLYFALTGHELKIEL